MFNSLALLLLVAAAQPIPYNHKTHLALGLQCQNCHTNPDPGEMMGYPVTKTCMGCRATVKMESAAAGAVGAGVSDSELCVFQPSHSPGGGCELPDMPWSGGRAGSDHQGSGYVDGGVHRLPSEK